MKAFSSEWPTRYTQRVAALPSPMVDLRGVTRRFGSVTAVDRVDLSILPGEFITLLGPSGCGKTTLLRMISGFETPDEGSVWLDGKDVTREPPYRRDVNQVFQSYALFPHLTVGENIAFGLRMKRVPRREIDRRVIEAAAMVSLGELLVRRPSQLSGGQRQRVALARAIVCQPRVLLLDEPLSALDAKLRHAMQFELKRLQQRLGITFLFVTHDQTEALTMSDRIAVVRAGRIAQLDTAAAIYARPTSAFVADFLGQANVISAQITGCDGDQIRLQSGGVELLARGAGNVGADVLLAIRPETLSITTIDGAVNSFDARVVEQLFRGATRECRVDTPLGRLTITTTSTGGDIDVHRVLRLCVAIDHIVIVNA